MTCCTFVYSVINLIWNKQNVFFIIFPIEIEYFFEKFLSILFRIRIVSNRTTSISVEVYEYRRYLTRSHLKKLSRCAFFMKNAYRSRRAHSRAQVRHLIKNWHWIKCTENLILGGVYFMQKCQNWNILLCPSGLASLEVLVPQGDLRSQNGIKQNVLRILF